MEKIITKKRLFMMLFFACFGMSTEIFFVAFSNLTLGTPLWNEPPWSLTGKTYVWMFPIYMMIPVLGGPLFRRLRNFNILARLSAYAAVILGVEFLSGWLLDMATGQCPWEYTTGWHVMGYMRLDYAPFWAGFAFLLERLYLYLDNGLKA